MTTLLHADAPLETAPDTGAPEPGLSASSLAKRQQIIDGAVTLFLRDGYEGTSMSHIAREAGVSKGTLYNYFDSKADLFTAMVEIMACQKFRIVYAQARTDHLDCRTTLRNIAEALIRMLIEPQSMMLYRIIVAEAPKFPLLADIFWQHAFGRSITILSDWIAVRAARGEIAVADPLFAAEQFAILCQTRIVHRKRFELAVDMSDRAIAAVAEATSDGFMKIYAPA